MPGAILLAFVAPEVVFSGVPAEPVSIAVLLVAIHPGSIVLAMVVGLGVEWLVRNGAGGLP